MKSLVGFTGFVGSNLAISTDFDGLYNSANIEEAYGTNPDLLVYAGVPAQKFIANKYPEKDMAIINEAIQNIEKINPKQIVLISTIDVYKDPVDVDEDTRIDPEQNQPYGKNRFFLEEYVRDHFDKHLVVRLPALYGRNIKKNFIYDLIHYVPSLLNEAKFKELSAKAPILKNYYKEQDNGFFALSTNFDSDKAILRQQFEELGFSALNFTDSRATYQFYNLKNLWNHIQIALNNNIRLLCLATEPVSAGEVHEYITGQKFENRLDGPVPHYNYKSIHCERFGGKKGYLLTKKQILKDLKSFVITETGFKLSASDLAWNITQDREVLEEMKELGFKGLEIAPSKLFGNEPYKELEQLKNHARTLKTRYGLSICSMQSIWYQRSENIFASEDDRKALLDYTFKAIDFASSINCKNLVFGCPKNRNIPSGLSKKEALHIFEDFLSKIDDYAKKKEVFFSLEPNPRIYSTNFLNTTRETAEFLESHKYTNIGLNLDFGTIIQNKEKLEDLKQYIHLVRHIHISEPYLEKPKNRRNHKKLASLLKESHYSGYISLEMKEQKTLDDIKTVLHYLTEVLA